ncbi:LysM peptidoglycan-binding domain-containing protein [Marinimicrobium alkaliphilum]|uniref:LysM peptidoglycan-binding domain-containing protein n=1 Tax=Marinimicrobium alkaliphilum TaxID=2202654 RepID=UPI000DBA7F39|nr:LysM peptidoglycan-binding domain-containing protein [Marinimicrobium alkaliphilum]
MTSPKYATLALGIALISGCSSLQRDPQINPDALDAHLLIEQAYCPLDDEERANYELAGENNLWWRLRAGYGFDDYDNDRIDTYLSWYSRNQLYLDRVTERAGRYMYYIISELEANDMPTELALLPIIESAFDPFAYSHGRASGIWQFVPATGRQFGLKQNWWYDGRRDIVASTDAAIRYLKYLHQRFDNDWLLALAAYNTGQGNLQRAINRNRREGRPTDYWNLPLPRETRNYVPQLLALAQVVGDPEAFGVTLNPIPNQPFFARVGINSQIDLAQAAELAEIELEDLYRLNPAFNRWATDPEGPHELLIPLAQAETFSAKLDELPKDGRVGWDRYRVRAGDTLGAIARRHRTSVSALQSTNNLNSHIIREGQTLLIPTASQPSSHYSLSADQRRQRTQERSQGRDGSRRVTHTVRSGDSFWRIANQYGVTIGALTNWNGMAPNDTIRPGQELVVWTRNTEASGTQATNREGIVRRVNYRVRRGDSLARIASRFNVSVRQIADWNSVSADGLIHPGQSLTLYVDVTQSN